MSEGDIDVLEKVLTDSQLSLLFWGHLDHMGAVELLNFWLEIEDLRFVTGTMEVVDRCRELEKKYFAESDHNKRSVMFLLGKSIGSENASQLISEALRNVRFGVEGFEKLQREIFHTLKTEYFAGFIKSSLFQNYKSTKGKTNIHKVCEKHKTVDHLKKLLAQVGGNLNANDMSDWTPLHCVASSNLELCKFLLENGADPRVLSKKTNNSPLHFIAKIKTEDEREKELHLQVMQMMIDAGAKINSQNGNGETPLHIAAWFSKMYVVEFLINNRADPNISNLSGDTSLHYALRGKEREDIIRFLLEKGADPNIKSLSGTPLTVSINHKMKSVEKILQDWGFKKSTMRYSRSRKVHRISSVILKNHTTAVYSKKPFTLWIPPEKSGAPMSRGDSFVSTYGHVGISTINESGELIINERKEGDAIGLLEAYVERQISTVYELV